MMVDYIVLPKWSKMYAIYARTLHNAHDNDYRTLNSSNQCSDSHKCNSILSFLFRFRIFLLISLLFFAIKSFAWFHWEDFRGGMGCHLIVVLFKYKNNNKFNTKNASSWKGVGCGIINKMAKRMVTFVFYGSIVISYLNSLNMPKIQLQSKIA